MDYGSIAALCASTIIGLLIKSLYSKLSDMPSKTELQKEIEKLEEKINKNTESDYASRKEMWIVVNDFKNEYAEFKGEIKGEINKSK